MTGVGYSQISDFKRLGLLVRKSGAVLTILAGMWFHPLDVLAQTDREFWFVAPDITKYHNGETPIFFYFTTTDLPANIKVDMPANPSFPVFNFSMPAHASYKLDVSAYVALVENRYDYKDGIPGKSNKAIHIVSDNLVTVYYECSMQNNPDIFALKGKNALGTEFFVSFQERMFNMSQSSWQEPAYSAFEIAFTEDNTYITLEIPLGKQIYNGSNPPLTGTVVLGPFHRGESYSGAPAIRKYAPYIPKTGYYSWDKYFGRVGADHLNGVRITTNGKKIAVTLKDDSMKALVGGCYDLAGDQTVPVNIVGKTYIAMKGQLSVGNLNTTYYNPPPPNPVNQEVVYALATRNNTRIFVNSEATPRATLNAGQSYMYELTSAEQYVKIWTPDSGFYCLQISGWGCEMGEAVLPPVDQCTGSTQVGFTRSHYPGEQFYLNIMVRKKAKGGFLLNGSYNALLDSTKFIDVPGTQWAYARIGPISEAVIPRNVSTMVSNTKDVFHLGCISGGASSGTRYGYFSDYNPLKVEAFITESGSQDIRLCFGNSAQIVARGGVFYKWIPSTYLSDSTIAYPVAKPPKTITYKAYVSGACDQIDSTVISIQVSNPVEARFNIDTTFGCAPLRIKIRDQSYGVKKSIWKMGDGYSFIAISPTLGVRDSVFYYTYQQKTRPAVTRSLMLVVENPDQCRDTLIRPVIVYPEVTAEMSAIPDTGCHPLGVLYTNASKNADAYQWEFGDGASSSDTLPFHIFNNFTDNEQTYRTRLVARSQYYCYDTAYKNIHVYPYLKADFTVSPVEICAPYTVTITNNSQGGAGIKTVFWDFGDGSTSSDASKIITHTYTNTTDTIQTRTLRLVIGSGNGCFDTLTRTIKVYPDVFSSFTMDKNSGCHPLSVNFTPPSNNIPVSWFWDFGDGGSSSLANPSHVFLNNSPRGFDTVYNVRLVVSSQHFCTDTTVLPVTVHPNIKAEFTVSKGEGCAPMPVIITNNSFGKYPGISNYNWDFGDGSSTNQPLPVYQHTYQNNTTNLVQYNLRLIVNNLGGCQDTLIRPVKIYPKITAGFTADRVSGCNPLDVHFTNTSNVPVASSFNWTFGDGISSDAASPVHRFEHFLSKDTTFSVQMVATSDYLCRDTQRMVITVYSHINADFTLDRANNCSPFPVQITNTSSGGITSWFWDFRDGTTSTLPNPTHTYINKSLADQIRNLRLVVRNSHGCTDTMERQVSVFPEVRASFSADRLQGCEPLKVSFTNTSNEPVASVYSWTFGNKGTSPLRDPVYVFDNDGPADSIWLVRLQATSVHGCTDDTVVPVTAYAHIEADFKVANPQICSHESVAITNTSRGGVVQYFWDFNGDGTNDSNRPDASFSQPFTNYTPDPLVLPLRLIVKNSHTCFDTLIRQITVYPKITARFTMDSTGCHPLEVHFTNQTLNGNALLGSNGNYDWYFGDGSTSGDLDPVKTYFNYGSTDIVRQVKLVASSLYQCRDSVTKNVQIYHRPKALFAVDRTISCPPFDIQITNNSVTSNATYYWDFGDGQQENTSSKAPFVHRYTNSGINVAEYLLNLRAVSNHGCDDEASLTVSVYPKVTAAFDYDAAGCSPLVANFTNRSLNANFYKWEFGDGKVSVADHPSIRFVNTGANDLSVFARLIATSVYNCSDTLVKSVTVYGQPAAEFDPSPVFQVFRPFPQVQITNYSNWQSAWNYAWNFDDGTTSTDKSPQFVKTYQTWGRNERNNEFNITMRAYNPLHPQCADTVSHIIRIMPPLPEIQITNNNPNGCEPYEVGFKTVYQYAYTDSFYWDFGDGTFSREVEPVHVYQHAGTYTVQVTVTGDGGKNTAYKTVVVHPTPVAEFDVAPRVALLPDAVVKGFNKSQLAVSYLWDFGDGGISTEKDPEHLYKKLGKFTIKQTVWSEYGCVDSITKPEIVSVEGEGMIEFPNAFTPNMAGPSDGHYANLTDQNINDIFHPKYAGVKEYHLEIYTRWGEKIFECDDVTIGWDGYYKGKLCKQDVYVWKAKGKFWNGREFMKAGDVTLLHKKD